MDVFSYEHRFLVGFSREFRDYKTNRPVLRAMLSLSLRRISIRWIIVSAIMFMNVIAWDPSTCPGYKCTATIEPHGNKQSTSIIHMYILARKCNKRNNSDWSH